MTSIEWFSHEVYKTIELHSESKISATISGIRIAEARHKAIEMHKNEMDKNCSQLDISEEKIQKAINEYAEVYQCPSYLRMCRHDIISACNFAINWYKEQLKNADQKS
jgi:hypothetical protein